jgi:hypothetical protein
MLLSCRFTSTFWFVFVRYSLTLRVNTWLLGGSRLDLIAAIIGGVRGIGLPLLAILLKQRCQGALFLWTAPYLLSFKHAGASVVPAVLDADADELVMPLDIKVVPRFSDSLTVPRAYLEPAKPL